MRFIHPWGLLAFLSVAALILLYILRQQHRETPVSSTYLWKRTQLFMQADTPWQKLRKSLLFLLQLLMLCAISLAIARPVIGGVTQQNIIVIVDSSASMRGQGKSGSLFEQAKKEINGLIDALAPGNHMTIIKAGTVVEPAVTQVSDKRVLRSAAASLECGYGSGDVAAAVMLAESMRGEDGAYTIYLYSDMNFTDTGDIRVINLQSGTGQTQNAAVTNISSILQDDGYLVMSAVISYEEARELTLELYCDGRLADAKRVACAAGTETSVYWNSIPESTQSITVKITDPDRLAEDNARCHVLGKSEAMKVLIADRGSFFLEKVLAAVGTYDIYKTTADQAAGRTGYDLYIFDGFVPDEMPSDGAVWLINPDRDVSGLHFGAQIKGTYFSVHPAGAELGLTAYLDVQRIAVARFREILNRDALAAQGWRTVLNCGELPVVLVREYGSGQRTAVLLFDMQESNLPLLKEFPIFIQHLITYSLPTVLDGGREYLSGDAVTVRALPYAKRIAIKDPEGRITVAAPPFPPNGYSAKQPGIYTIVQSVEQNADDKKQMRDIKGLFAVHIPPAERIITENGGALSGTGGGPAGTGRGNGTLELWPYLLLLALILAIAEWWVYYREN